jgi:hypothetical protein
LAIAISMSSCILALDVPRRQGDSAVGHGAIVLQRQHNRPCTR